MPHPARLLGAILGKKKTKTIISSTELLQSTSVSEDTNLNQGIWLKLDQFLVAFHFLYMLVRKQE